MEIGFSLLSVGLDEMEELCGDFPICDYAEVEEGASLLPISIGAEHSMGKEVETSLVWVMAH